MSLSKTLEERYATVDKLKLLYQQVFNSEAGQLVLEDLRNRCYVKTPTSPEGPFDQNMALINEGRRRCVLHIQTMLQKDGEATT